MKARFLAWATLLAAGLPVLPAHQVDEYLQATFIAVEPQQLRVDLFLTPGLNVLPTVLAAIDTDGDGSFSAAEQRAYVSRVLQDLSFALDGTALAAELKRGEFPTPDALSAGRGDIHLELVVKLRPVETNATLRFENRHLSQIAAYQVNGLTPRDPTIRLGAPQRDALQSTFTVGIAFGPRAPAARKTALLSAAPRLPE